MSMVSGSVAGTTMSTSTKITGGKKRGRKPKIAKGDDASVFGQSTAASVVSAGGRGATQGPDAEEEDDDDDDVAEKMGVAKAARTNEEKEKEKYYRATLVNALDPDQYARYERWRSSKLSDSVVRRLVNQTLSQSVPQTVVLAVKSVTKIFAGDIIERARKIQTQSVEASLEESPQTGEFTPVEKKDPEDEDDEETRIKKANRRGPLTPEHLREALRRYKAERSGGMVGLMGIDRQQHPTGTERFGNRVKGKRLNL
jgi:transcription initiation factor TFIID subunit 11